MVYSTEIFSIPFRLLIHISIAYVHITFFIIVMFVPITNIWALSFCYLVTSLKYKIQSRSYLFSAETLTLVRIYVNNVRPGACWGAINSTCDLHHFYDSYSESIYWSVLFVIRWNCLISLIYGGFISFTAEAAFK